MSKDVHCGWLLCLVLSNSLAFEADSAGRWGDVVVNENDNISNILTYLLDKIQL